MEKKRYGLVMGLLWVLILLTASLVSAQASREGSAGEVGNAASPNLAPNALSPQTEIYGGITCPVGSPGRNQLP